MGRLIELAENPREGYRALPKSILILEATSHQFQPVKLLHAEEAHWVVARKEILGRGNSLDEVVANFGPLPSALAVATVMTTLQIEDPACPYLEADRLSYTCTYTKDMIANSETENYPLVMGGSTTRNGEKFLLGLPFRPAIAAAQNNIGISLIQEFPAIES